MIKGIAFDLEGTVVDVEAAHHNAHIAVAREAGLLLDLDSAIARLPHFIGGPDEKIMEEIYALGDKKIPAEKLLERDKFYYEENIKTMAIEPRAGFLAFLSALQQKNIPFAIGSLTPSIQARLLLDRSGLTKIFSASHIILKEDVEKVKPAPDVFLKTAERMGIDPKDQMVFEDSPRGVQAAQAAGSRAIGMPVYAREDVIAALKNADAEKVFLSWKEVSLDELL